EGAASLPIRLLLSRGRRAAPPKPAPWSSHEDIRFCRRDPTSRAMARGVEQDQQAGQSRRVSVGTATGATPAHLIVHRRWRCRAACEGSCPAFLALTRI